MDESSFAGMLIFQTGLSFPAAVVCFWLPGSVLVPLSIMISLIMTLDQVHRAHLQGYLFSSVQFYTGCY